MQEILSVVIVLIFSVIIHELAHGYSAEFLGDPTPRLQGRLTVNPIKHLDFFGSILLPGLLFFLNSPLLFGYAKPIQYNPYNILYRRWGPAIVAFAGPLSNILLVGLFTLMLYFSTQLGFGPSLQYICHIGILINLVLAFFNLIPIPPLDGHYILFSLLPSSADYIRDILRRYSWVFLIIFILFLWKSFFILVNLIYTTLVGI